MHAAILDDGVKSPGTRETLAPCLIIGRDDAAGGAGDGIAGAGDLPHRFGAFLADANEVMLISGSKIAVTVSSGLRMVRLQFDQRIAQLAAE
jgi:hypothetical protein